LNEVSAIAKEHGAAIIENLLAKSNEQNECLARAACQYGAVVRKDHLTEDDLVAGFGVLEMILTEAEQHLSVNANSNTQRLLLSVVVGRTMGFDSCHTLFTCSQDYFQTEFQQARATCEAGAMVCPAISIGCAMCGLFAPATCSQICTFAGLYCSVGGLACKAQAATAVPTTPTTTTTPAPTTI